MKVFVHTKAKDKTDWVQNVYEFKQLPALGEYCELQAQGEWYEILLVVHCPFPTEFDAEIWAEQVDQQKLKSDINPKPPTPMKFA